MMAAPFLIYLSNFEGGQMKYKIVYKMKFGDILSFLIIFVIGIGAVFLATSVMSGLYYNSLVREADALVEEANAKVTNISLEKTSIENEYWAIKAIADSKTDLNREYLDLEKENRDLISYYDEVRSESDRVKTDSERVLAENKRLSGTRSYITGYNIIDTKSDSVSMDEESWYNTKLALGILNNKILQPGETLDLYNLLVTEETKDNYFYEKEYLDESEWEYDSNFTYSNTSHFAIIPNQFNTNSLNLISREQYSISFLSTNPETNTNSGPYGEESTVQIPEDTPIQVETPVPENVAPTPFPSPTPTQSPNNIPGEADSNQDNDDSQASSDNSDNTQDSNLDNLSDNNENNEAGADSPSIPTPTPSLPPNIHVGFDPNIGLTIDEGGIVDPGDTEPSPDSSSENSSGNTSGNEITNTDPPYVYRDPPYRLVIKGLESLATSLYNESRRMGLTIIDYTGTTDEVTSFNEEHNLIIANTRRVPMKITTLYYNSSFQLFVQRATD